MQDTILDIIKKELALENASEQEVETIVAELGGQILKNILINFTGTLTDHQILEWDEVLASEDQDQVNAFIMDHVDDMDALIATSSREVIDQFKGAKEGE